MTMTITKLANILNVSRETIEQIDNKQLFVVRHIGYKLYFSYNTCIAIERDNGNYIYITTEKFSKTTTVHVNLLVKLAKRDVNFLDRFTFDDLYDGIARE